MVSKLTNYILTCLNEFLISFRFFSGMGTVYIAVHCFFKCGLLTDEKRKTYIIQALTRTAGVIGKMKINSKDNTDEKVIKDEISFFKTILDKAVDEELINVTNRESYYDSEVYQIDQAAVIEIRDELELLKKELNERCQRIEECLQVCEKIFGIKKVLIFLFRLYLNSI